MNKEYLIAFVKDFERLMSLNLEMDVYDIENHSITMRKYLLDSINITHIWKFLGHNTPIKIRNIGQTEDITGELLGSTYLYINFLNCFNSDDRIFDLGVIENTYTEKYGFSINSPKFPNNSETYDTPK
jgi:hypothetical protein